MNDKMILMALLRKANIDYIIDEYKDTKYTSEDNSISVHKGYIGFVTIFKFDDAGNLIDMGAWE